MHSTCFRSVCLVPSVLAGVLVLSALMAGCGERKEPAGADAGASLPEVYTNMMEDAEFVGRLKGARGEFSKVNRERLEIQGKMQALVDAAKKRLAADGVESPADAAVKEELERHPERYPEWKPLYDRISELNGKYKEHQAKLWQMARVRKAQEAKDRKAVETGAARAKGK